MSHNGHQGSLTLHHAYPGAPLPHLPTTATTMYGHARPAIFSSHATLHRCHLRPPASTRQSAWGVEVREIHLEGMTSSQPPPLPWPIYAQRRVRVRVRPPFDLSLTGALENTVPAQPTVSDLTPFRLFVLTPHCSSDPPSLLALPPIIPEIPPRSRRLPHSHMSTAQGCFSHHCVSTYPDTSLKSVTLAMLTTPLLRGYSYGKQGACTYLSPFALHSHILPSSLNTDHHEDSRCPRHANIIVAPTLLNTDAPTLKSSPASTYGPH
ncbi:hypothetical protein R3P38DRAFT_3285602 [Favolaschia claudopus]|uniref:Uncharacterized protein n=1 Tax=Favolaschia claudopus TaxID=2862362 RepID=A0AAW0A3K1_9AGAR